jgi:hypothetical protein
LEQQAYSHIFLLLTAEYPHHYLANQTGPIHLSLKEVTMHSGSKVLKNVDDSHLLIVGNPLGILDILFLYQLIKSKIVKNI